MPKLEIMEQITTYVIYTPEEFKTIFPEGTDFFESHGNIQWVLPENITMTDLDKIINEDVIKNFGEEIGSLNREWRCEFQTESKPINIFEENLVSISKPIVRILFSFKENKTLKEKTV